MISRKSTLVRLGFYAGLCLMLCMVHAHNVNFGPAQAARGVRHAEVMSGEGRAPYTYRVLMPWLVAATQPALRRIPGADRDTLELGYVGWRFLFTLTLLVLFDAWLRCWIDPPWAVAGTVLLAALHPASYMGYWFQPDSCPDLVLWVLVALLTMRVRFGALYPLVLIGSLNRETAVFAVLIHTVLRFREEPLRALALRTARLGLCWLVPFVALRVIIGIKPWDVSLVDVARSNFAGFGWVAAVVFFGMLWVLPWTSWRKRPVPLRRLAVLLTVTYLPLQTVFGRFLEPRLLLPLTLAYMPLLLMALRDSLAAD